MKKNKLKNTLQDYNIEFSFICSLILLLVLLTICDKLGI